MKRHIVTLASVMLMGMVCGQARAEDPPAELPQMSVTVPVGTYPGSKNNAGIGFDKVPEGGADLEVRFQSSMSEPITYSRIYDQSGQIIFWTDTGKSPAEGGATEIRREDFEHVYKAAGAEPNRPCAFIVEGYIKKPGGNNGPGPGGGGERKPDFYGRNSYIDIDVDSTYTSTASPRVPNGTKYEDTRERLSWDASESAKPNTRLRVDEVIVCRMTLHWRKQGSCQFEITSSSGDVVKLYSDSSCTQEVTEPVEKTAVRGEDVVDYYVKGIAAGTAVIKATFAPSGGSDENVGARWDAQAGEQVDNPEGLVTDEVDLWVTNEDPDTNRDDLVEVGNDIDSFGKDTGTIAWQTELVRSRPQVYIPLATAAWNQLGVHAYVAQGAFDKQRSTYWVPPGIDAQDWEGSWQAYSLHTRVDKARKALDDLNKKLDEATGPKTREPIQREIDALKKAIKGHEKEIGQKWPNGDPSK